MADSDELDWSDESEYKQGEEWEGNDGVGHNEQSMGGWRHFRTPHRSREICKGGISPDLPSDKL